MALLVAGSFEQLSGEIDAIEARLDAAFLAHQRNCVLVGGTGTGKTHLAIAIARACIRDGARGRFFNVVDLVNKLETEVRAERQGRIADRLARLDFAVLDELGYLPFAQTGGQLLFHLISHLYEQTSIMVTTNFDQSELEEQLGDRILSRLVEICGDPLPLYGTDHRLEFKPPEA